MSSWTITQDKLVSDGFNRQVWFQNSCWPLSWATLVSNDSRTSCLNQRLSSYNLRPSHPDAGLAVTSQHGSYFPAPSPSLFPAHLPPADCIPLLCETLRLHWKPSQGADPWNLKLNLPGAPPLPIFPGSHCLLCSQGSPCCLPGSESMWAISTANEPWL